LTYFWNKLKDFGVSDKHPEENQLIRLFNQMAFISSVFSALIFAAAWVIHFHTIYLFIVPCVFSTYFFGLVFNYLGKIYAARYVITCGTAIWVSVAYFLIGGYFGQGMAIIAAMATTHVCFQKKKKERKLIHIFNVSIFLISGIFVAFNGPYLGVIEFPFDEVLVFSAAFGWTVIFLYFFEKDRANLLDQLKSNNEELKTTTEELERFTYIASHDLKSPLRTIISFIGLAERDIRKGNYENISEKLNYVKTGAQQMNFLIKDILELSRIKNVGKEERTMVDLNLALEKAKFNLTEEILAKKAILHHNHLPEFYCNELQLILIFQNFIQNGIKYNESKQPVININAQIIQNNLVLSFNDNGIGIDEAFYDTIFQYFKRLHTSDKYQGTGLGLGLCKRIISDYGGSIKVDSTIGKGSTFTLSLPNGAQRNVHENETNAAQRSNVRATM